jgi:hypothetical protein
VRRSVPSTSGPIRPAEPRTAAGDLAMVNFSVGDRSRPLKMVTSRPIPRPLRYFCSHFWRASCQCFLPSAMRIAIWWREHMGIQIFWCFFTLASGLGAELDAMILRKCHWRRVYFNRRCGHLAGAYDYFLLRISSVLFFQVVLQPDRFLSDLTSLYERSTEKGSVWVKMKQCECSS